MPDMHKLISKDKSKGVHNKQWKDKSYGRSKGYVYVFDLGFDGLYKIGYAANWEKRFYTLSAANPRLKHILAIYVDNVHREEYYLHWHYFDSYVTRESFALTQKQIEEIYFYLVSKQNHEKPSHLLGGL